MGQVTIYLDDETERKLQAMVKQTGMSKSSWIAGLIRERASQTWPDHVRRLAGAWTDLPTAEELRKELGQDVKRDRL